MSRLILIDSGAHCDNLAHMNSRIRRCSRLLTICICLLTTLVGCGEEGDVQEVEFAAVDSLLGDTVVIDDADLAFRIPAGFMHAEHAAEVDPLLILADPDRLRSSLIDVYEDTATQTHLLVLRIDSLQLGGDTTEYLQVYRDELAKAAAVETITGADHWLDDVYVKNLMVSDSYLVRFHMLLFGPTSTTVELRYLIPRIAYADMLARLESSIGSLYRPSSITDSSGVAP